MTAQKGAYSVTLAKANGNGGLAAIANPEGVDLIITRCVLNVITAAGSAITADIGVAANGSTSADNLLDGVSINTAVSQDNISQAGTNGKATQKWTTTQYVTATPSADPAASALVGTLLLEYIRP